MKAAFRADASLHIGSGHVMRSKTLADELRRHGAEIRFLCREQPGDLIRLLRGADYATAALPAPSREIAGRAGDGDYRAWLGVDQSLDAEQTLKALGSFCPDWLVVDHYGLDVDWERMLRPSVGRILAIDDLANRHHDCDLLLDQNYYAAAANRYTHLVPELAKQLLGPRFALLRPEFREARAVLRKRDGSIRRVLIFFGGVDATRETERALAALGDRSDIAVDVVVGGTNARADAIRAQCQEMSNATFHRQISNMAELMTAADFSFGAGGASHWERCCVGLPTAVTMVAPNQVETTRDLAAKDVVMICGHGTTISACAYRSILDTLSSGQALAMQSAGLELVDGRGAERVALSMCLERVVLRDANVEDAVKAWSWRNDPSTRKQSSNPNVLTFEEHDVWWSTSLRSPSRALLIGSQSGVEVGVLRYDFARGGRAVVSIYLDPGLHGIGLGTSLLRAGQEWLVANQPDVREVEAVILPDNIQSQRAFARVGFCLEQDRWIWNRKQDLKQKGPLEDLRRN